MLRVIAVGCRWLYARNDPSFRLLNQDDGHPYTAGIRLLEFFGGFPSESDHDGLVSDKLDVLDFALRLGPPGSPEDKFCGLSDVRGANPQIAVRIHELAIG